MYNMYKKNTLGNLVKEIRTEHQLSQIKFSEILGYGKESNARISELETGTNIYKNFNFINEKLIETIIDKFNLGSEDEENLWKSFYLNRLSSFGYPLDIKLFGKYIDVDIAEQYIDKNIIPNEVLYNQLVLKYDLSKEELEDLYLAGKSHREEEEQKKQKHIVKNTLERVTADASICTDLELKSIKFAEELFKESGFKSYAEFYRNTNIRIDRYIAPQRNGKPCLVNLNKIIKVIDLLKIKQDKYLDIMGFDKFYTYDDVNNLLRSGIKLNFSNYFVYKIKGEINKNHVLSLEDNYKLNQFLKDKKDIIKEQIEIDDYGYEEIDRNNNGEIEEVHNSMEYKFDDKVEEVSIEPEQKEEPVSRIQEQCILSLNLEGLSTENVSLIKSFVNNIDKLSDKEVSIIKTILNL